MSASHVTNKPSQLLEPDENSLVISLLGPKCTSLATTVAQLFYADDSRWVFQSAGVLCFVRDANVRSFFLRFYDLDQRKMLFEQEIYQDMRYNSQYPFFYQIEAAQRIVGFNFVDNSEGLDEAHSLAQILRSKVSKMTSDVNDKQEPVQSSAYSSISTPAGITIDRSATLKPPAKSANLFRTPSGSKIGNSATAQKAKKPIGGVGRRPQSDRQLVGPKRKIRMEDIGKPSDFRHVQHVGYDNIDDGRIDIIDVTNDPVLKFLFGQIGQDFGATVSTKRGQKIVQTLVNDLGGMDKIRERAEQSGYLETRTPVVASSPSPSQPGPQPSGPVRSQINFQPAPPRPQRPSCHDGPPLPPPAPRPPPPPAPPPPPKPSLLSQPPMQSHGAPPNPLAPVKPKPQVGVGRPGFLEGIENFDRDNMRHLETQPSPKPAPKPSTNDGGTGDLCEDIKVALRRIQQANQGYSDSEDSIDDDSDDDKWD